MIDNERQVKQHRPQLDGQEKHEGEENVDGILGYHQRVQTVALIYRVLVVCFQFIKSNDVEDHKEYQHGSQN